MPTPRLRSDLAAHSVEDGGLRFFDVQDPRSGASMRLYEHEWLIARRMDGQASLDEVAAWAGQNVGFAPTVGDLRTYARTLDELGFFDEGVLDTLPQRAPSGRAEETSFEDLDAPSGPPPTLEQPARSRARSTGEIGVADAGAAATMMMPAPVRPQPPARPAETPQRSERTAPPPPAAENRTTPPALKSDRARPRSEDTDRQDAVSAPKKSRGGVIGLAVVTGLAFACAAAYFLVLAPALAPAHVKVQALGGARDLVHRYEGKGVVMKTEGATLSFGGGGTVVDVVAKGAEVKPGQTLASLASYSAAQKELNDVRDRETYYEEALRKAQAKHKNSDVKRAQSKVNEKRTRRLALEERVNGARIVSALASTVDEVLVKAGDSVAPGAAAIKLADKKLSAELKLAAGEGKTLKVDAVVPLINVDGTSSGDARVKAIDGDTVKLEIAGDGGGALKAGAEVQLIKNKIAGVIRVPVAAVVKSQGGADQVFVLVGEIVKARPVTVAERTGADAFVSAGLARGDRVVVSPAPTLQDGQKALAE